MIFLKLSPQKIKQNVKYDMNTEVKPKTVGAGVNA